ncbi:helix-turn-helix domain-containing protein [Desulfosporosinus nitroreducens]|uniref:helix-turn-helix domain-containing protein n=1 Tax=Desulfosporosinus nitroreducens TaxID=2018668 RepID=UPI00207D0CA9|nr:helix-turn-helix domain-containing protein [Desulfosporosinus nitroreducens]MCO1604050.1 helix-turn-helix domain-containing protein [Desulfosporosinus nitroreducens]
MTKWQRCMDSITTTGGAVFSNKALRKYFKEHHCKNSMDKSYIDLADIYGQIVSQGAFWEKQNKTTGEEGFFYTSADYIADELCLSVRRVRDLIDVLADCGLLLKRIDPGHPNSYAPRLDRFIELTKDVTFKYREQAKDKKFYREHGRDRETKHVGRREARMF